MKLVSLNTWGGKIYNPLTEYVKKQSKDTDIFCFQEVFHSPESRISSGNKTDLYNSFLKILPQFTGFYSPTFTGYDTEQKVDFPLEFGQATFIRRNLQLISEETYFVHGEFDYKPPVNLPGVKDGMDLPRNMHCIKLKINKKEILIGNFHGYWFPGPKNDTSQRIAQSKKIRKIYDDFKGPKIIAGDFNLMPNTKSMEILEEDMMNLIKKFRIKSTRNQHYTKTPERFADYVLVSKEVKVNSFYVPEKVISDHLPLVLDFSV